MIHALIRSSIASQTIKPFHELERALTALGMEAGAGCYGYPNTSRVYIGLHAQTSPLNLLAIDSAAAVKL